MDEQQAEGGSVPPRVAPQGRTDLLLAAALVALVALFHGGSVRAGFVYDDWWTLVANPIIRVPANLTALWGPALARAEIPDAGRPLMLASEILDHILFGERAAGYHLQNLLWHAANVVLLFALGRRLLASVFVPFAAAALFAVHPLMVEAVAAINYREDLMATAFVLAALTLLRGQYTVFWPRRLLAAALVALGAFAKESASLAPALLVMLDLSLRSPPRPRREVFRRALPDYGALAVAAAMVFAWRWWVMGAPAVVSRAAEPPDLEVGRWALPLQAAGAFLAGLAKFVWPVGLSPEYPDPPSGAGWLALNAAAVGALVAGSVVLVRRRSWTMAGVGLLWAVVAYLPSFGLVALTNLRADRYLYLPAIGLCLAVAVTLQRLSIAGPSLPSRERTLSELPVSWVALSALVLLLGVVTLHQGRIWRDDDALFTAAVRGAPGSARAWTGLARAALRTGRSMAALRAVDRALLLADDPHARELRGLVLLQQGDKAGARSELGRALAEAPLQHRAAVLNNLGFVELELGDLAAAIPHFVESAQRSPLYDRPALNRARALLLQANRAAAEAVLRALLDRVPESSDGWKQLGALLARAGRADEAAAAYRRAQKLTPADREVARALAELIHP